MDCPLFGPQDHMYSSYILLPFSCRMVHFFCPQDLFISPSHTGLSCSHSHSYSTLFLCCLMSTSCRLLWSTSLILLLDGLLFLSSRSMCIPFPSRAVLFLFQFHFPFHPISILLLNGPLFLILRIYVYPLSSKTIWISFPFYFSLYPTFLFHLLHIPFIAAPILLSDSPLFWPNDVFLIFC